MLTPSAFPAIPGWGWQRRAVTATTTVVAADRGYTIDATSGTYDIVLTAAATLGDGFCFGVYNSGSGTVTINPDGAETIRSPAGSSATLALSQGQGVLVMCDGTGFDVVASAGLAPTAGSVISGLTAGRIVTAASATAVETPAAISTTQNIVTSGTVSGSNLSGTNTGDVTLAAIGAVPNANAASLSGQQLTLQPASASFGGVLTTGAQTIAGAKTLTGVTTVSDTTASTTTTTGALVVGGGVGIANSITIGNDGAGVSIRSPSFVLRSTAGGVAGNIYMDMGTGSASHGEFIIRSSNGFNDRLTVDATGNLIVYAGQFQLRTTSTPASASATGVTGTISWDTNFLYVCVATDTWKRMALLTW